MKLVVGGIKGGAGKSTLATNLAVARAFIGKKVLLVDADEQKSSSDWADQREHAGLSYPEGYIAPITTISLLGKSINQQIAKMQSDYHDIIIDTGGRDTTSQRSALTIADAFLLPFRPRSFDVWTLGQVKLLIEDVLSFNEKMKCFYVINQGDSKGHDNLDAMEIIERIPELRPIKTVIGHRKAFANAAAEGMGVMELLKPEDAAYVEMVKLHKAIYE